MNYVKNYAYRKEFTFYFVAFCRSMRQRNYNYNLRINIFNETSTFLYVNNIDIILICLHHLLIFSFQAESDYIKRIKYTIFYIICKIYIK